METKKVVLNRCYGGFGLSAKAKRELGLSQCDQYRISREDPKLVEVIEKLGKASWGTYAELEIVEIPEDVEYEIFDYDGIETVVEISRHWP